MNDDKRSKERNLLKRQQEINSIIFLSIHINEEKIKRRKTWRVMSTSNRDIGLKKKISNEKKRNKN